MLIVSDDLCIPDDEFEWQYARSGGPGGQNVNKVASKVLLRWRLSANTTIPAEIMSRLRSQAKGRITADGELLIQSQRYRDQDRNRQDCLDKLKELLLQASVKPKSRRPTRPTRGSKERRLAEKKHRAKQKARRRPSAD